LPELHTQSLNWALDTVLHLTLMVMPSHDQLLFDQVGGSILGCSFFFKFFPIGLNWWVILASNIRSWVTLNSFTGNIRKTLWQRWSRSSSDRAETAWLSQCDRAC
jgi:hypothetical protein